MATHVLIHLDPAGLETFPAHDTRPETKMPIGLRSSSGFVREGDMMHVRTTAGLATARGVLVAIGLQGVLAAGALLLWQLMH